jgi:hypothetical protein
MRAGTTPIHTFKLPTDIGIIKNIKITYSQNGRILLEKYLEDLDIKDDVVSLSLTQEESFKFNQEQKAEVQMRIITNQEDVLASDIKLIYVRKCLDSEVLT